jgi:hypothetical protein
MFYTFTIKQQMHIYKYFRSHIITLQQHVPANSGTIIRVPYIDCILVIRHPDEGHRSGPKHVGKGKINFTQEQATKAQRGSRGTALLFL